MKDVLVGLGLIAIILLVLLGAPWLAFWATGVLFGWRPEVDVAHWGAFWVLMLLLHGNGNRKS